ncbi:peroxiredoxin family protein [Mucilaginibacter phyllosphaerae]|uniref:Thiol-disulfide isomerase/thioredoxin n=1 Tax=Mucilaginibacter phyllosphaerae TaxID=1812349 RepID=A0A4Y8ACY3_9SPHI|nr:TlpA disulfide reductase family protein [Mucilaginibacter phyllosphaerae]MBB3969416.1 thiol-disulfide isomerase/thioredoxin [Mucilaginibacter phyllosphaerae]TEW65798.1 TlpA family protein disulfide reductase [Mucilaginibacter phyllosphaerae]GGH08370.1 hypothetical protein GCM10007352_13460 [Mucilaginibacter phyllosphaerae]
MKKNLLVIILLLITLQTHAQSIVKINGSCPLIKDGTEISLVRWVPRRIDLDKKIVTKTSGHRFTFEVNAAGGEGYLLYANKKFTRLYLGPGKADVWIADSVLNKVTVTGNLTGAEYDRFFLSQSYSEETKAYKLARITYFKYLDTKDVNSDVRETLKKKIDSLAVPKLKKDIELTLGYIKNHPLSYLNTLILYEIIDQVPEDAIKTVFKTLSQKSTNNTWGKELQYRIDNLFIGATAPNFKQTDTAGRQVSLDSFRGKYVLIDFWASWCIPCRADNPNLIKAVNDYGDKNFTIVSVSLDSDKERWFQAIKHDKLTWTHLSDLKEWKNEVSVQYYVYAVPDNYLIDPSGKIIAKNIRGEELLMKLKELVKY